MEVLRALSFEPRVLILDEPTGVLGPAELSPFLDLLRRLRGEGRIIILVTHKLAEALAVADRITVLRHGRIVASTAAGATSESELARMMIGEIVRAPDADAAPLRVGAPALSLDAVSLVDYGRVVLDSVTLALREGEIAGIAGVDGNGQEEFVELLARVRAPGAGRITVHAPDGARAIAAIPENRDRDGLVLEMALWENLLLAEPIRRRFAPRGWLRRAEAAAECGDLIARFRIRAPDAQSSAAALSGGNRQRLEVARAVASAPRIIVAHNPCRGLDLAATADVHRTLLEFAAGGGAVLLLSSDLDELLEICGRLFVMSRGRLRETGPHERNPERLGMLMAGSWE
jgi:simple sugar transport system ATP-binding protein